MGRLILVASGKGGVGKSTIVSSMAVALAGRGLRTLLLDADVGLRSVDLMMGIQDKVLYELADCLSLRCTLREAAVTHGNFPLLHIMTSGQDARPKDFEPKALSRVTRTLKERYDMVLVDAPAGIGRGVKNFVPFADEIILAATADDVCLRDTEKMAGMMMESCGKHPWLIINRFDRRYVKQGLVREPASSALALDLPLLGVIPYDESVYSAMVQGKTIPEGACAATAKAIDGICDRLLGLPPRRRGGLLGQLFGKEREGV